jgi:Domain of unknown function (DUF4395)
MPSLPTSTNTAAPALVDVRGPRFAAWVTTGVIVATLIAAAFSSTAAAVILGVQAVVFAIGAWRGPREHPYGLIFQRLVLPRLGPVTEKEPVPPLKFAQLVGFVFAIGGVVGFTAGIQLLGLVATGFALVAAFLNAAFGICLGCQIYPLITQISRSSQTSSNRKEFVHGSL